jgi:hypothetical protein
MKYLIIFESRNHPVDYGMWYWDGPTDFYIGLTLSGYIKSSLKNLLHEGQRNILATTYFNIESASIHSN